jgi:hypothetical protein
MNKLLMIFMLVIGLSACQTTSGPVDIRTIQYQVAVPPPALLKCNPVMLPKSFQSDKEVASELAHLYTDERVCSNNMKAVRDFLTKAQQDIQ